VRLASTGLRIYSSTHLPRLRRIDFYRGVRGERREFPILNLFLCDLGALCGDKVLYFSSSQCEAIDFCHRGHRAHREILKRKNVLVLFVLTSVLSVFSVAKKDLLIFLQPVRGKNRKVEKVNFFVVV